MSTLTHAQRQFIDMFEGEKRDQITDILARGDVLFAEVTVCLNGQFSTGSMGDVSTPIPALDLRNDIESEIAENIAEYERQINEGDRDEDDEWEGELMAVRWNGDDTLSFYTPDHLDDALSHQTLEEVCGY